jgi:hypothetical protein
LIAAIPFGLSPRNRERRSTRATRHGRVGDGRNDAIRFDGPEFAEAGRLAPSICANSSTQVLPPAPESAQPDIAIALQVVSR